MSRAVSVVACRRFVRLRLLRLAHLRAIIAAIGARTHTEVAEEVEAALCSAVRRRLGAVQEEVVSVEVFQRHTVPIDEYAVRIAMNSRAEERAEIVEFHIHAEAERAVMIGAIVVLMVEEVVHPCVDGEVLADVLLDEQVPNAETLFTVLAALADVVARAILFKQVVCLDGVAVEHPAEEAAPERRTPAVCIVLVVDTDIEFMRRAIEQAVRQIIIARIDCVQVGIAELCTPVLVELVLDLCLDPRELCLADVAEAVDAVGDVAETLAVEVEVHELTREVVGHIVRDLVVEHTDLAVGMFVLSLESEIDVERFLGLQIRIADPVPAEMICARAAVHLPVVEQLAEPRLAVARADVRLEPAVFRKHVCHAEVKRCVRPEAVAVVDAQDGREDGLRRDLPAVLYIGVGLCEICFADQQLVFALLEHLSVIFPVECDVFVLFVGGIRSVV